jgi:hypothetical protein
MLAVAVGKCRQAHKNTGTPRYSACEQVADRRRLAWVHAAGEDWWVTRAELIAALVKTGSAVTVALSGLVPRPGSGRGAGSSW